jgi:hypothetical protein
MFHLFMKRWRYRLNPAPSMKKIWTKIWTLNTVKYFRNCLKIKKKSFSISFHYFHVSLLTCFISNLLLFGGKRAPNRLVIFVQFSSQNMRSNFWNFVQRAKEGGKITLKIDKKKVESIIYRFHFLLRLTDSKCSGH